MSGVAGYVDTAGVLALFGLFTAHVTGDLVSAGMAVAEQPKLGALARVSMLPIFMITVAAVALYGRRQTLRGKATLTPLLALMTIALGLFCATGVTLRQFVSDPDAWAVEVIGGTGVIAMAIQNTIMREALSGQSPTTIMTGNLTQVTIDLVEILIPSRRADPEIRQRRRSVATARLAKFGIPLLGFMSGVALGAILTHYVGLFSIVIPTVVTGWLTVAAWRATKPTAIEAPQSTRKVEVHRRSGARFVLPAVSAETESEIATDTHRSEVRIAVSRRHEADEPPSSRSSRASNSRT